MGSEFTVQIERTGDLLLGVVLEIALESSGTGTGTGTGTYYPAEALIESAVLTIDGVRADACRAGWMRVYDSLFRTDDERRAYRRLVDFDATAPVATAAVPKRFYVPLPFFMRAPGMALPLVAMQYSTVRVCIKLASAVAGIGRIVDFGAWAEYAFLDGPERERFASTPREYLVEQTQFGGPQVAAPSTSATTSQTFWLNFQRPVKYLAWAFRGDTHGAYAGSPGYANADYANLATWDERCAVVRSAKLQLGGQDRFDARRGSYFNEVQPYRAAGSVPPAGVYLYSFALNPRDPAPSGTCNFSKFENAVLRVDYKRCADGFDAPDDAEANATTWAANLTTFEAYAVGYNVLRVENGRAIVVYPGS